MIQALFIALIKDVLKFLKKNPDFFSLSKEKRHSKLKEADLEPPEAIIEYLGFVSENSFIKDITVAVSSLHRDNSPISQKNSDCQLLEQFVKYLLHDFLNLMENPSSQEKLFSGSQNFHSQLQEIIANYSYQEITTALINFISSYHEIPYLVVQTPRPVDKALRQQIRAHLQKKTPFSFTIFQVNNKLIGGLRLFLDGSVHDHSWLSQINKITALA